MNPLELVPSANPVPVHWGWFKLFLMPTFMIHILLVNMMIGAGLISLISSFKENEFAIPFQKNISGKLPVIIALVINFGVAPFIFLQVLYGRFIYVSSQLMAVYWLSIIGLMILGYYSAYYYKFKFDSLFISGKLFLGTAVVIFLFIALLFTSNMTLMLSPGRWSRYFVNSDGTILNLSDPSIWPRYLHFITASLGIGGLFIAVMWKLKKKETDDSQKYINYGMKWFTYATLAQIPIGFWFQMSLPKKIGFLFLGNNPACTALFALSLILVAQTIYFGMKNRVWPSVFSVLILISAMVAIRDAVRNAFLAPYFKFSDIKVLGQYSPMLLFIGSLAVIVCALFYVFKLMKKSETEISAI